MKPKGRVARTNRIAAKRIRADGSGRLAGAGGEWEVPAGASSIGAAPKVEVVLAGIGPAARGVGGNDAEDAAGTVATGDAAPSAARIGWLSVGAGVDSVEAPEIVATGVVVAGIVETAEGLATGAVVATVESPALVEAGTAEAAGVDVVPVAVVGEGP